jgi:uncharacterized protein YcbX
VHVARIGFTPVKGGRHLEHAQVELAPEGPVGDRRFCLVDPARRRVVRTAQNPTLLQAVTGWDAGVLSVALPTGLVQGVPVVTDEHVEADYWGRTAVLRLVEGPWAAAYSAHLGYEVVLAQPVRAGEVVYGGSVTVVTTAALRLLTQKLGREVASERFRATFLLDTAAPASHPEDDWLGQEVSLGEARVLLTGPVPRCAVIDLEPHDGRQDLPVLRTLAEYRRAGSEIRFGVEGRVTRPGRVRVGDAVEVAAG